MQDKLTRAPQRPGRPPGGATSVWKCPRTAPDRSLALGPVPLCLARSSCCKSFLWADAASSVRVPRPRSEWPSASVPAQGVERNWDMKTTPAHTVLARHAHLSEHVCVSIGARNAGRAGRFWKFPRDQKVSFRKERTKMDP